MQHFFSTIRLSLNNTFSGLLDIVKEPRQLEKIYFPFKVIFMYAIFIFILNVESRNNIKRKLNRECLIKSINKYFGIDLNKVPDGATIEKILKKVSPAELQNFLYAMNDEIIRKKIIKRKELLFEEYFMVTLDMTRTQSLYSNKTNKGKIIKGLLWEEKNGVKYYFRAVLEVKITLFNGLSIPLATEFVRNDDTVDGKFVKQDCELKAAYRLLPKLRKQFPKLKICLLLDSLYGCEEILKLCKKHKFKYIMSIKPKKIPTLFASFLNKKKQKDYIEKKKILPNNFYQRNKIITGLNYAGFDINFLELNEYQTVKNQNSKKTYYNVFITNLEIDCDNAYEIGKAGRKRWKTEHSFNRQKKHIFNLEHAYTTDENAMKCYHYFLQIADFIFLFMAYSFTSENENLVYKTFGTLLEFYNEIRESFISEVICLDEISARKQLRLITP